MNWINPVFLQIGPIFIHWYGLMYVLTFIFAYFFLKKSALGKKLPLDANQKDNLLISAIIGIILGGRIGYVLFYNLPYYFQNPSKILAVWEGGLSFHGGLIGTILAIALYVIIHNRHKAVPKLHFLPIADIAVLLAPVGIFLGRIGNFINGELYGRISTTGFCLNFPTDPNNCRYPSQLFESFGEGLLIFLILYIYSKKNKVSDHPGRLSALFLILYGLVRTFLEFFREPDAQIGYLLGGPTFFQGLTLGQLLSLLTALAGLIIFFLLKKHTPKTSHTTSHHHKA